jgi:tRNA dimethylallyltransferase
MLDQGFVQEVEKLYNRGDLHKDLPSMRAVGYRQVWDHLTGELNYEEMIQRGIVATRQFAKRQFTWLRADTEGVWFDALDTNIFAKILKKLSNEPIFKAKL